MPIRPAFPARHPAFCRGPRGRSNVLASSSSPLTKRHHNTTHTRHTSYPTRQLNDLWQQRELKNSPPYPDPFPDTFQAFPIISQSTLPNDNSK